MNFTKRLLWFNNDDEENAYIDSHYPLQDDAPPEPASDPPTLMVCEGLSLHDFVFYLIVGYILIEFARIAFWRIKSYRMTAAAKKFHVLRNMRRYDIKDDI